MSDRVIIFDTTLRDGEQALAASLTVKEKLQIAQALERLGVDVMEVGFPVSSPGDFQSVQTIARHIKNSRVCALARALPHFRNTNSGQFFLMAGPCVIEGEDMALRIAERVKHMTDLVIYEHSPTALIASVGRPFRKIAVGTGFTHPPLPLPGAPFAPFSTTVLTSSSLCWLTIDWIRRPSWSVPNQWASEGGCWRASSLSRVDLPEPLWPIRP